MTPSNNPLLVCVVEASDAVVDDPTEVPAASPSRRRRISRRAFFCRPVYQRALPRICSALTEARANPTH